MARRKDRTRRDKETSEPLFHTATYARLSVDSAVTESDSIASQQMLMRDFLEGKEGFALVREYKDDGVSGTRFDRQGFESLLSDVRNGKIDCIVVKDFSRFGRDHIEVGNYLEKVFPFLGVRFISVNDGYDSFDRECADKKLAVILKNLVNEYIAKDTSVKVASGYSAKQESGEYDGGYAPYGYFFADQRKTGFVIDENAAAVVKDIFLWTIQGDSAAVIVKRLTEKCINPPKTYRDTGNLYREEPLRRYWSETTVNGILRNMAYAGHMALHKWKSSKADGLKPVPLDESEWKITYNTHAAIIPEEDFLLVQEILRERKERYGKENAKDPEVLRPANLLKGKVFCGDCLVPVLRMGTNYKGRNGKIRIYRYRCRTYREKGIRECSSKSIAEKELERIVCRAVIGCLFRERGLEETLGGWCRESFWKRRSRIEMEKRMEEGSIQQAKNEKIRLYMEYSSGVKDGEDRKEWYLKEKRKREEEILCHETRKAELKKKLAFLEGMERKKEKGIQEAFAGGLNAQMVSVFVERIFLYDGKRVEIVLNFV